MSDELKPCPFCGKEPYKNVYVHCNKHTPSMYEDEWNTRPIEDALTAQREQARNSELNALEAYRRVEKERDALRKQLDFMTEECKRIETQRDIAVEALKKIAAIPSYECKEALYAEYKLAEIERIGAEK